MSLHWHRVDAPCAWCIARTPIGEYIVTWSFNERGQTLQYPDGTTERFKTREEAKAAAQEDFDKFNLIPRPEKLSFNPDDIPF